MRSITIWFQDKSTFCVDSECSLLVENGFIKIWWITTDGKRDERWFQRSEVEAVRIVGDL